MAELPDDVGQAARTAYDRLWNDGAQESACLVAALLAAYPLIAVRVRAEAVDELCEALSEPVETPGDHPGEPPYRTTWDRALDITRGRTAVWSDLLRRAAVADAEWLAEYRGRAGAAVFDPVAEAVAAERQRIVSEFATVARVADAADGETDAERLLEAARRIGSGYPVRGANTAEAVARLLRFVARFISVAGSVPVATPQPGPIRQHSAECGGPAVCSNLRCRCACHFEGMPPRYDQCYGTCTVDCGHRKGEGPPVATPTEPAEHCTFEEREDCPRHGSSAFPVPAVQPDGWGEGVEAADHPVNCECPPCVIDRLRDSNDSLREQLSQAADEIDRLQQNKHRTI